MRKNKGGKKAKKNILDYYSLSWTFIKQCRNYILLGFLVFLFSMFLGVTFPQIFEEKLVEYLSALFGSIDGFGFWELFAFIFKNNASSAFTSVLFGIFFGIYPLFSMILNGYVLGFVAIRSVEVGGLRVLWQLVPHGILELPAIFLSVGLGIKLGFSLFTHLGRKSFGSSFKDAFTVFFFVVLPLLFLAALIETALILMSG